MDHIGSVSSRRQFSALVWTVLALAAAHVLVGIGMSVVGNPSGWLGGVFYAISYATPLVLIALALRSSQRALHVVAGWFALALGAYYALIVVGNWSGYTPAMAVFATAITVPTVAVDLAVFWAVVLRRARPVKPSTPAAS